ncbi:MAG: rhomboid family intramembrane serine protease [Acidobacteria bacterium]|nr:rhomboid family intramembrane serine protease [Acidobacteriota bacterium]
MSPAIKAIIWANIAVYVVAFLLPVITRYLGLIPQAVFEQFWLWQPITYMFVHAREPFHILFNMLGIWMFGVELERMWGTRAFVKYYFVAGLGAAATTLLLAVLPAAFANDVYNAVTIGASGALYGVLLAYGLYFPDRPILMFLLFPIPAKYFVMIMGGIAFLSTAGGSGSGVAHAAHLGGLVTGYLYLKNRRGGVTAELKYRYLKWKMNRLRRKFDLYSGGRNSDYDRRIH